MADYQEKEYRKQSQPVSNGELNDESFEGKAEMPPAFNPQSNPTQMKQNPSVPIQMEDKKKDKSSEFEIDYKLLPPSVQMAFWKFKLSLDTGNANLGFKHKGFGANLGYKYGSDLNLGVKYGGFSGGAGYKPGASDFSLKAGYKLGDFNAGISANPLGKSASLSLGYGAPLAPMPGPMTETMMNAGNAVTGMGMGLPGAMNNPYGYYKENSDNIDAIKKAAKLADKLHKQKKGIRFGAGVTLSASELGGFNLSLGAQYNF